MAAPPAVQQLWAPSPSESREWDSPAVSAKILGGAAGPISIDWARTSALRLHRLRDVLRSNWVGLTHPSLGALTDWLLAAVVARENVLLLGPPGVGKSEIATRLFKLLGLTRPRVDDESLQGPPDLTRTSVRWWREREQQERRTQKYFHYLLSRFTQPEELFGPVEISLLRQGMLVRVNFGLLTGPGVRAAFLDEIFKASSSILNTLLTLTQDRTYFNWGGMLPSDLSVFIGASNEMPGGFASGTLGVGSGGEDFQTLHAFVDRFPIRLYIPVASGTSELDPIDSDLSHAFGIAIGREAAALSRGDRFAPREERPAGDRSSSREDRPADMPSINDVLLLGRACLQHAAGLQPSLFDGDAEKRFRRVFLGIAASLQSRGTSTEEARLTWTISPRKLLSLYKVALCHALVRDDAFVAGTKPAITLERDHLQALALIWDTPLVRLDLEESIVLETQGLWNEAH